MADHLVVATALRCKLVVLHEDADFETVARYVPQLGQERIIAPAADTPADTPADTARDTSPAADTA